jgi:hypothetical protein
VPGCVLHFLKLSVTVICARLRVRTLSRASLSTPDPISSSVVPFLLIRPAQSGARFCFLLSLSVVRPSARQGHRTPGSSVAASDLCVPATSVRRRSLLGSLGRQRLRFQFDVASLSHEKIGFLLVLCVDCDSYLSRLCS